MYFLLFLFYFLSFFLLKTMFALQRVFKTKRTLLFSLFLFSSLSQKLFFSFLTHTLTLELSFRLLLFVVGFAQMTTRTFQLKTFFLFSLLLYQPRIGNAKPKNEKNRKENFVSFSNSLIIDNLKMWLFSTDLNLNFKIKNFKNQIEFSMNLILFESILSIHYWCSVRI